MKDGEKNQVINYIRLNVPGSRCRVPMSAQILYADKKKSEVLKYKTSGISFRHSEPGTLHFYGKVLNLIMFKT